MARRPWIPVELTNRPFSLNEARRVGLDRESLRNRAWKRLGRALYASAGLPEDPLRLLQGWMQMLPPQTVFVGFTAAWLLGLDFDPVHPVEVAVREGSWARSRGGLVVRHSRETDTTVARGLPVSNFKRTLTRISLRLTPVETLVAMDAALKIGLADHSGLATCRRLRYLASVAQPAESPMETRLRWLLMRGGLPEPEVQVELRDTAERFLGPADLYYRSARLVIEYDGANHRERLVEDNRRQNALIDAGFKVLRFTGSDLHSRPATIADMVRSALKKAA